MTSDEDRLSEDLERLILIGTVGEGRIEEVDTYSFERGVRLRKINLEQEARSQII